MKKVIKVLGRGVPKRLKFKKTKHLEVPQLKGARRSILNLFVRNLNNALSLKLKIAVVAVEINIFLNVIIYLFVQFSKELN